MEDVVMFLIPPLVIGAIGATIVALTKTISDNRTRRELIKAGGTEETMRALFAQKEEHPQRYAALKWGLLTASVGLGLVVVQLLPISFEEPAAYGLLFLFAGGGLLAYYAVASIAAWPSGRPTPERKRRPSTPPRMEHEEAV